MIGLRVAHLIPDLGPSSSASECGVLLRWLLDNGHEALLVTADEPRAETWQRAGAEVAIAADAASLKRQKGRKKLTADLLEWTPDLIHVHHITSLPLGIHLADQADVPLVVSLHSPHPVDETTELLTKETVRLVLVPSDAMRAHYCGRIGLPPDRVAMLPYGVDCSGLRAAPEVGDDPAVPVRLAMAGNVDDEGAGFTDLVEALAQLAEGEQAAFAARLLGRGTGLAHLEALIAERGLDDRVAVEELADDLAPALDAVDVFVYPVYRDHNILCLAKAMGAACAVVACAVGGVPELVTDEETGLLVPAGDREALVAALARLVSDRDRIRAMGRKARQAIAERYSAEMVGCAAHEVYRGLLRRGGGAKTGTEIVNTWRRMNSDPAKLDGVA